LEHAASDELIERMAGALKHPSHDPHGAPIPTRAGEIEITDSFTLADLSPGSEARVRAVRDDHAPGLKGAEVAGLFPGTWVRVVSRDAHRRIALVEVGSEGRREVPFEVAHRVYVVPASTGPDRGR
jgi:DtxR family Mn-dependent transcriptional regulator